MNQVLQLGQLISHGPEVYLLASQPYSPAHQLLAPTYKRERLPDSSIDLVSLLMRCFKIQISTVSHRQFAKDNNLILREILVHTLTFLAWLLPQDCRRMYNVKNCYALFWQNSIDHASMIVNARASMESSWAQIPQKQYGCFSRFGQWWRWNKWCEVESLSANTFPKQDCSIPECNTLVYKSHLPVSRRTFQESPSNHLTLDNFKTSLLLDAENWTMGPDCSWVGKT